MSRFVVLIIYNRNQNILLEKQVLILSIKKNLGFSE
jgi:hypothetical protein